MRHFFAYDTNGNITGASTYRGGWPECDCHPGCGALADPECTKQEVVGVRESTAQNVPNFAGFVLYDCLCPSSDMDCQAGCVGRQLTNYRIEDGQFVEKADGVMQLDGSPIEDKEIVDRPPATPVVFKLVAPVPDGTIVTCSTRGQADISPSPETFELTMTNGESEPTILYAPGQGIRGRMLVSSPLIKPQDFQLRGWAV